eukprot:gene9764-2091_t
MFKRTIKLFNEIPKKFLPPTKEARRKKNIILTAALLTSTSVILYNSYQTVPINERNRFILVPTFFDEIMGNHMLNLVKQEYPEVDDNHPQSKRIKRIGNRIKEICGTETNFNWEFCLIDGPILNAFCLPGGKVVFYSELLNLFSNDDEIAGIMAHEIGHALCRHNAEQITSLGVISIVRFLIMETFFKESKFVNSVYSLLFTLPKQRRMEYEADFVGIHLMSRACYNPYKMISAFEKLKESSPQEQDRIQLYFSTHPSLDDRLEKFKDEIPYAVKEFENFCEKKKSKKEIKKWYENFEK